MIAAQKYRGTVLIITNYFPPAGGGGVIRMLKFAKYLPSFGWRPIILTPTVNTLVKDPSLLNELHPDVRIFRTPPSRFTELKFRLLRKTYSPPVSTTDTMQSKNSDGTPLLSKLVKILERLKKPIESWLLIPDQEVLWVRPATHLAKKIFQENRIDAIMTSGPPHSVHAIGHALAKKYHVPWLIDYRDDWYANPLFTPTSFMGKKIVRWLEQRYVKIATALTAVTPPLRADVAKRFPASPDSKFITLWNGFDPEDFRGSAERPQGTVPFQLSYVGSFGTTRTARAVIDGIALLKRARPELFAKLHINFVGQFTDSRQPWFDVLGPNIQFTPHQTHAESIKTMRKADALLLILTGSEDGAKAMPGKFYEYLAARRPILALTCPGIVKDFIQQHRLGWTADVNNSTEVAKVLVTLLEQSPSNRLLKSDTQERIIAQFSRERLTQQLAKILNTISTAPQRHTEEQ